MPLIKFKKELNSIHFALMFPYGAVNDPLDRLGLAHLVEHLAFRKAGGLCQENIYEMCEVNATKINAVTGETHITFDFACRKDVFERTVRLLADMIIETDYSEADIEAEKAVVLAELYEREWDNMLRITQNRWLREDLGRSILGNETTVNSITADDIRAFKRKMLASHPTVVMAGGFDYDDVVLVKELFHCDACDATVQSEFCPLEPVAAEAPRNFLRFVPNNGDVAQIYYSFHAMKQLPDDGLRIYVLDNVLCRGFRAYLTEQLREKLGYVYEIESDFSVRGNEINWIFSFATQRKYAHDAIKHIEDLLSSFRLDDRYFKYVKAYFCDNLPFVYDSPSLLCSSVTNHADFLNMILTPRQFSDGIQAISFDSYNEFYRRVLSDKQVYVMGRLPHGARKLIKEAVRLG